MNYGVVNTLPTSSCRGEPGQNGKPRHHKTRKTSARGSRKIDKGFRGVHGSKEGGGFARVHPSAASLPLLHPSTEQSTCVASYASLSPSLLPPLTQRSHRGVESRAQYAKARKGPAGGPTATTVGVHVQARGVHDSVTDMWVVFAESRF
jgi:hypothetical protein